MKNRLEVYHAQTEPLIEYYRAWEKTKDAAAPKFIRIDGIGDVERVRADISSALAH